MKCESGTWMSVSRHHDTSVQSESLKGSTKFTGLFSHANWNPQQKFSCAFFVTFENFCAVSLTATMIFGGKFSKWEFSLGVPELARPWPPLQCVRHRYLLEWFLPLRHVTTSRGHGGAGRYKWGGLCLQHTLPDQNVNVLDARSSRRQVVSRKMISTINGRATWVALEK